jgi:hypothetical protein
MIDKSQEPASAGESAISTPLKLTLAFSRAKDAGDRFAFSFEEQDYVLEHEDHTQDNALFPWGDDVIRRPILPGRAGGSSLRGRWPEASSPPKSGEDCPMPPELGRVLLLLATRISIGIGLLGEPEGADPSDPPRGAGGPSYLQ